ncbi:MAG: hypothetical protein ACLFSZ_03815 [Puniceicoccaceae bacterium]
MSHNRPRKLIETVIPLPEINDASVYDKMPGIGPHPKAFTTGGPVCRSLAPGRDLNPVPALITKATIDYPARYFGKPAGRNLQDSWLLHCSVFKGPQWA